MAGVHSPTSPGFIPERAPEASPNCTACGERLELEPLCPTCGAQRMPPNVARASTAAEQDAVIARIELALAGRPAESVASVLAFGEAARRAVAVVNVSVRYAIDFVASRALLYATYSELVEAGARRPAPGVDDARRRSVESMLFGSYGEKMRYAALSLGGSGLVSYGAITMVLRDEAIAKRASVLEENSFDFVERHTLRPTSTIPPGYRAPWPTRHQLAMAKCGAGIDDTTTEADYASLLCTSGRSRQADEFIEVFVFGPFGSGAIERVIVPTRLPRGLQKNEIRQLREKASVRGIPVEEA